MNKQLRLSVIVCMCIAFTACTSLRTVVDTKAGLTASAQAPLAPGNQLTLTTRDGTQTPIVLTSLAADFIEGSQEKGAPLRRFDLAEVVKIERREPDGVKTTLLVIAIAAGVFALALASAQASLAGNL